LLAAAAVSVSTSLSELAVTGAESVRVAFRLGVHVDGVSQLLESREADGNLNSWAYVVTGISAEDVQREIDQYNAETVCPVYPHPPRFFNHANFLASPTQNSPKFSLAQQTETRLALLAPLPASRVENAFRHSQVLRYSKHLPLPVYNGLCHASHLYNVNDINIIVNG